MMMRKVVGEMASAFTKRTVANPQSLCRYPRQAGRFRQIHLHQPRYAGFAHGHAAQLVGVLHGCLVVGDHHELHSLDMSRTSWLKRPMLPSSSGASTSSSRQNGAGFRLKIAITSATAVIAFSPPDSNEMWLFRLPGGRAIMVTPASSRSSPVNSRYA